MKNIRQAAEKFDLLDNPNHRKLWLRNGVFCPFAADSVLPDDYNNGYIWGFFVQRLNRMRKFCDWREVNNPEREDAVPGQLMIAVANLWFRNVRRDIDARIPLDRCGRDELGLIPHPNLRWLLGASIGHRHHGQAMTLGVANWDPQNGTVCTFDFEKCNICWETSACNKLKFDFDEEYYLVLFGLVKILRTSPVHGLHPDLTLPELPNGELVPEYLATFEHATMEEAGPDNENDEIGMESVDGLEFAIRVGI